MGEGLRIYLIEASVLIWLVSYEVQLKIVPDHMPSFLSYYTYTVFYRMLMIDGNGFEMTNLN